jgi:hypothetical protein
MRCGKCGAELATSARQKVGQNLHNSVEGDDKNKVCQFCGARQTSRLAKHKTLLSSLFKALILIGTSIEIVFYVSRTTERAAAVRAAIERMNANQVVVQLLGQPLTAKSGVSGDIRRDETGPGSLSWWLPVKMDEVERHRQKLTPPDAEAWNHQMYRVRVLDQLVYDNDPNLTNVLIGENWKIWRVDFTRAFRLSKDLRDPKDAEHCDRQLLEKLKALDGNELAAKTKGYLTKDEVKAVMARRDKIVALLQKLIAEKGESEVLY